MVDHGEQPGHDGVQLGHGKPQGHGQEHLVRDGKLPDHDGEDQLDGEEGQLDGGLGEGEDRGHCGAGQGDEAPGKRKTLTCPFQKGIPFIFLSIQLKMFSHSIMHLHK